MANFTPEFEAIINDLKKHTSGYIKVQIAKCAFHALDCTAKFKTAHALNMAASILHAVTGGSTVLKYLKEVAPFKFSKEEGFHGKMTVKNFDVYKVQSFEDWKVNQKKANSKTPYQRILAILEKEDFVLSVSEFTNLMALANSKKGNN